MTVKTLKILIVDSDAISRRVLENLLVGLGHQVQVEADTSILRRPLDVDVVFIDPGPVELNPDLPRLDVPVVLLLSGQNQPKLFSLSKPFQKNELETLLEALARVI